MTPTYGKTMFSGPSTLTLQAGPTALGPGTYDAVVRIQALTPFSRTTDVYVALHVTDQVQQHFLPLVTRHWRPADWVDPANGGVAIYPTADLPAAVDLPFPVTFYGRSYNKIYVSVKGYLSFSQPGAGAAVAQNTCLPTAALPNDAIYALWQDWDPNLGGQVFVQQPAADRFAITWFQMRRFSGDMPHSFQIVLSQDATILLQYHTLQAPTRGTIGIENWDGTVATQIVCDGSGDMPSAGAAFVLDARVPW